MKKHKRSTFSGKLGFVLSAAGASVGLGNIWRFPYETGNHGGAVNHDDCRHLFNYYLFCDCDASVCAVSVVMNKHGGKLCAFYFSFLGDLPDRGTQEQ